MQIFRFSPPLILCLATLASPALGEEWQRFVIRVPGPALKCRHQPLGSNPNCRKGELDDASSGPIAVQT